MNVPNQRRRTLVLVLLAAVALLAVTVAGILSTDAAMVTDFSHRNLAPCPAHPFGTDWMGRDMLARTLAGLSLSIRIGILTAAVSAVVALVLGVAAATLGRRVDAVLSWLIDLVMGIPHILLVMLISLALGKGFTGVVAGVALSHWTSLARLLRGEVLQLREAPYVQVARKLGRSPLQVARDHLLPHLLPQFLTASHRGHPVGEYELPHHREVVALPLSRPGPGGDGGPLRGAGRAAPPAPGPRQHPSVRRSAP